MNHNRFLLSALAALLMQGAYAQQPYGGCWHPERVRTWSPETDRDAKFNRARVPLANRFKEPSLMKANEYQWYEGQICNATILYPTCSQCPSQGDNNFTGYQPTYWQYMDKLVYWAGSASEGIIIPPPAPTIDAAHAQGVKVLGQIFFPPPAYGGTQEWVAQMLEKEDGKYIFAKKLYDIARYMGFDGWFINEEISTDDWTGWVKEFMSYADADGQSQMEIQWYNARNNVDVKMMKTHANTSQFLEYGYTGDYRKYADEIGCSVEQTFSKLYAGVQVVESGFLGWNKQLRAAMPKTGHVGSLDLFCPEEHIWKDKVKDLLNTSDNCGEKAYTAVAKVFNNEEDMWVNDESDPSYITKDNDDEYGWQWLEGVSAAVLERSAIQSMPFVSSMSVGVGKHRFVNGKIAGTHDWYHSGMQSVLPTWRWWIENRGKLKVAIDWDDAWNVGSSFKISGKLTAGDHLMRLYKTMIPVTAGGVLRVVYKGGTGAVLEARLSSESSVNPDITLQPSLREDGGWTVAEYDLSSLNGKTLYMVALNIKASEAVSAFSMNLGEVAVLPKDYKPEMMSVQNFGTTSVLGDEKGDVRLTWDYTWSDDFDHFDIYTQTSDGVATLVGQTRDEAFYIPTFSRNGDDKSLHVRMDAVMKDGTSSKVGELDLAYPAPSAPVVRLFMDKSYMKVGDTFTVTARGTGRPTGFEWVLPEGLEFADGSTNVSNPVTLKAVKSGRQTLVVKATNAVGTSTTDIQAVDVYDNDTEYAKVKNVVLGKTVVAYNGSTNKDEVPSKIIDGETYPSSTADKWCNVGSDNYVTFDLEGQYRLYGFKIYDCNSGPETGDQISSYQIAVSDDGENWTTVIDEENTSGQSVKNAFMAPVNARFVKFMPHVDGTLRVWEFEVYGIDDTKFTVSVPSRQLTMETNEVQEIVLTYDLNGEQRAENFSCSAMASSPLVTIGEVRENADRSQFVIPVRSAASTGTCQLTLRLDNGAAYRLERVDVTVDNSKQPNVLAGMKAKVRSYSTDSDSGNPQFTEYEVDGLTDGNKAEEALAMIETPSVHKYDLWSIFEAGTADGWNLSKVKVFIPSNNVGVSDNDMKGTVNKDIALFYGNSLNKLTEAKVFANVGETSELEYVLPESRQCRFVVVKCNLNPFFFPSLAEVQAFEQPTVAEGPVEVSGFNKDFIAEKRSTDAANYRYDWMYALYSSDIQEDGAVANADRELTTNKGTTFRLAPYGDNNVLIVNSSTPQELELLTPVSASALHFLTFSTSGNPEVEFVANYADGSKSEPFSFSIPFWEDNGEDNGAAVTGVKLYDVYYDYVEDSPVLSLYQCDMPVAAAKQVKSVSVARAESAYGTAGILAVSKSDTATSVGTVAAGDSGNGGIAAIYNLQGMLVDKLSPGVYVVKYNNGKTKKVFVKK